MSALEHEQKQDVERAEDMTHVRSYDPAKRLCGALRNPDAPTRWGLELDCVVCAEIWFGMSWEEQEDLVSYWKARG